jgi:hypothetical protein
MAGKEKSAKNTQKTQITQNVTAHYLKKTRLEARLKELFPQQAEFHIRVRLFLHCFLARRPLKGGACCR